MYHHVGEVIGRFAILAVPAPVVSELLTPQLAIDYFSGVPA
jgi:hypothetical protein